MTRTRSSAIFIAVFTIVMFVFYMMLAMATKRAPDVALLMSAVMGAVTAFTAAVSYGTRAYMHRQAFSGKKQAAANMDTHQRRTVEIDLPYDAAFNLALDALNTLDEQATPLPENTTWIFQRLMRQTQMLRLYRSSPEKGIIEAGLRSRTMGIPDVVDFSRITLKLEKIDAGTTRIHIDSQAKTVFELYDMGKNLHYVNQLALYLRRESQQHNAESRLSENEMADADEEANTDAEMKRRR